ncbi:MAG: hypothetical protein G01um101430_306 [Parcubacteria group bacterium Gr01-1014_30]|nr:MAG: hypothetical protein G01um101430_306 [Parcubacteria group bacterium Gr01-1014_30]
MKGSNITNQNTCPACDKFQHPETSPGGRIKDYQHWFLEHIPEPVPVKGWLALRLIRHAEGLVGLDSQEAKELGEILENLPKVLKETTGAAQIYLCCFTEVVPHLHFHFIPRYPEETKRTIEVFALQNEVKAGKLPAGDPKEAATLAESLKKKL